MERVLALSMRPKLLNDLVGQTEIIDSLKSQMNSGRIPHFFIISGPVGIGKTTLARILALSLQLQRKDFLLTDNDWLQYKKLEINEINAANRNGIDEIRQISNNLKYKPIFPSSAKIIILDEAHQLTNAAQNALITETEDVAEYIYYIFCTSTINKIIPALRRRAYIITPKDLTESEIKELLCQAKEYTQSPLEIDELLNI